MCDFTNTNNNDFLSTPLLLLPILNLVKSILLFLILLWKINSPAFLVNMPLLIWIASFIYVICKRKKDVNNDVVKLKLFPFSLRDRAKAWFSSLPKNSIDSWNKCKDAFISKYFPRAKIITLRNDILNFKQLDHEHVEQAWERMKLMIRNCPTHGLNLWIIIQKNLCRIEFCF